MPLDSRRLTIGLAALGLAAVAVTAMAVARPPSVMPLKEAAVTPVPVVASPPTPAAAAEPAIVAPAALVTEPAALRPGPATARETSLYGEAGMRVALDPETGELGPAGAMPMSIERSEAEALSRSTEGLREVVLPDGSVMIDLQGRFQEYVVIEVGPDGKRRIRCVQQPAVAREEVPVQ